MNKSMFKECMRPVIEYYGKSLGDDQLDLYYVELSRHPQQKLKDVLHGIMANSKFFPKVVEIKKRLGVYDDNGKEHSDGPEDHKEYKMHLSIAASMLESRIHGGAVTTPEGYTFVINLNPIVDHCIQIYEAAPIDLTVIASYAENLRINKAQAALRQIVTKHFAVL